MTWWGGSRIRDEESPAIQKDSYGIVLWYRMYDSAKRTFEPYA